MTTKYYVDDIGNYLGGFGEGVTPPDGGLEVPNPPNHALQLWVASQWQAYTPTNEEQRSKRHAAYTSEADPMFFKWQAGEATEDDWLTLRKVIRDSYPTVEQLPAPLVQD